MFFEFLRIAIERAHYLIVNWYKFRCLCLLQIIDRDKDSKKVKIHFVGYPSDCDKWTDGDAINNGETPNLGRLQPQFKPSDDSLTDRASAFLCYLGKEMKISLFSLKKESPNVRIEHRINMGVYQEFLKDIGVITKSRGRDVHLVNNNTDLCGILGSKWYERIINFNGDFCYVIPNTVRFWLHEKRAVKEFFYVGDH